MKRLFPAGMIPLALSLLVACNSTPTEVTTPPPSALPTLTSVPATAVPIPLEDRFANIPRQITLDGFPQFGFASAPISVIVVAGIDDPASATFYKESLPVLIERARAAEILVTFLPTSVSNSEDGLASARASVCASQQNEFWRFADILYTHLIDGQPLDAGTRLSAAATVGLNAVEWESCINSNYSVDVLNSVEREVTAMATFTQVPFVTVAGNAAFTDPSSLNFTINLMLEQFDQNLEEALTNMTATPDPESTDTPEVITVDPLVGVGIDPPFTITLPEGWRNAQDALLLQDIDTVRSIPFSIYTGPIPGGTGSIVLLWGFPNLITPSQTAAPDLWTDGLRLLRLAILEEGCNIGTDLRQEYSVGGVMGIGTQFAAVDCPELPDTRGWFVGFQQFNLNFVFYIYADPIDAMNGNQAVFQEILDSIQFVRPEVTPEAEATEVSDER